jgi:UDP-galactopyranose mutase
MITVIGAGLAGATVAQQLAWLGEDDIDVFDERPHVGGNAHTYRDEHTDVMVHAYGPHIFHTNDQKIWNYVRQFATFYPYVQRTKATAGGKVYSWPVNLHTINQVWDTNLSPSEASATLRAVTDGIDWEPQNFRDQVIKTIGPVLYKKFFEGYTKKQWGRDPFELPASIAKRIPIRLNYDDNAYEHKYQGIPTDGYTRMVENMLDHPRIKVHLGKKMTHMGTLLSEGHIFNSAAIDEWYDYAFGPLAYRTLDLETILDLTTTDYQGCAVMNHCDLSTPYTRSTEHRHFAPWEKCHKGTVVTREWSRDWRKGDIRYYPVPLATPNGTLERYQEIARRDTGITFIGRLGTYQYLDMDQTISASIQAARQYLRRGA